MKPWRNQRWRASAEPWVQLSGFTRPWVFSWMRSSPTAEAAERASLMSWSVSGLRNGVPVSSSFDRRGVLGPHPAEAVGHAARCARHRTPAPAGPAGPGRAARAGPAGRGRTRGRRRTPARAARRWSRTGPRGSGRSWRRCRPTCRAGSRTGPTWLLAVPHADWVGAAVEHGLGRLPLLAVARQLAGPVGLHRVHRADDAALGVLVGVGAGLALCERVGVLVAGRPAPGPGRCRSGRRVASPAAADAGRSARGSG